MLDDLDQFRRRAVQEREAAGREQDPVRREAHERMAAQFDRLAASDFEYFTVRH